MWRPIHDWKFGDKNFEAGADAMLEALRNMEIDVGTLKSLLLFTGAGDNSRVVEHKGVRGKLVFVPDEKDSGSERNLTPS